MTEGQWRRRLNKGENITERRLKTPMGGLPGGLAVKTSSSNVGGVGSVPGWGAKIPCFWAKTPNNNIVTNSIRLKKKKKGSCFNPFQKALVQGGSHYNFQPRAPVALFQKLHTASENIVIMYSQTQSGQPSATRSWGKPFILCLAASNNSNNSA